MRRSLKITGLCFILLFVFGMEEQDCSAQSSQKSEKDLSVEVGKIDFRLREYPAAPSPIRMIEIQVEIINPSPKETVPPNAIKVVAAPAEIKFSPDRSGSPYTIPPEELTLSSPLPPKAIRIMIMGFSLPPERLESISFEVQVNPPEGEKKTATYHF